MLSPRTKYNLRRASVLMAGFMIQNTLGTGYSFANMNPYITSYMRHHGAEPSLTYTKCAWIFVSALVAQAICMPLAGMVQKRLGSRLTCLLGCSIFCLGVITSYFSIQHSFGALVVTYGITFGIGVGLSYTTPLAVAMKWMKNSPGLANGIVNGGGGVSLIFNLVQTAYINPENQEVQLDVDGESYFDQEEVLNKVPSVFLVLGGMYAVIQLVSCLLLVDPPTDYEKTIAIPPSSENIQSSIDNEVAIMPSLKQDQGIFMTTQEKEEESKQEKVKLSSNEKEEELSLKQEGEGLTSREEEEQLSPKLEEEEQSAKPNEEGFSPKQVLKTIDFYLLFFIFMFNATGVVFLNSLYKAFGLSFINDDQFLSLVGTLSAIFNFSSRVIWGFIKDKLSFRTAIMMICSLFTFLILTLQLTKESGNRYLFLFHICLLIGTGAATYPLIPAAMAKRFGRKHITTNFGMVYASQIVTAPLTITLSQSLIKSLGWTELFFVIASCYVIGFLLAFMFKARDKDGKRI